MGLAWLGPVLHMALDRGATWVFFVEAASELILDFQYQLVLRIQWVLRFDFVVDFSDFVPMELGSTRGFVF